MIGGLNQSSTIKEDPFAGLTFTSPTTTQPAPSIPITTPTTTAGTSAFGFMSASTPPVV
jgi:hypothetical protein